MGMYAERQGAQRRETGGDANGGKFVKVQMHLKMNTDSAHQQQQSESTNNKSSTNNNNNNNKQTPAAEDKLALVHPMSFPHSSTSLHIHHIHIYPFYPIPCT